MATFTNKATLSYNGGAVDSNTVTGFIPEALSVTKTALGTDYTRDSRITYAVTLINSGTAALSGLTLTDDLGGYPFGTQTLYPLTYVQGSLRYFVDGVLQPTPAVTDDGTLTVTGINVPAGGDAAILYSADVSGVAPLGAGESIVNTVTVSGAGLPEPIEASETVSTATEPLLSITKELTPTTVPASGSLTYTFVISNSGNTDAVATDDLVVSDLFDPILTLTSVTLDGVALQEGTDYTYDGASGAFATVAGRITVPAATFTQGTDGSFTVDPGESILVVSGTI